MNELPEFWATAEQEPVVESARMCGMMMTLNMYEIMCVDYIGIEIDAYAEVIDVLTLTLMYRDLMLERTSSKICKAFAIGHIV